MDTRYQKGKIYTIKNREDDTKIYVGSTIVTLSKRLAKHRCFSKKEEYKNIILYKTVNGDWDNWYIELYENHPCNSKEELLKREGQIIREIGTLNKVINGRTQKEYYKDNKEKIAEYREDNKEKITGKMAEYYQNNKDKILEKKVKYYKDNKEKIAEKVICECGCEVLRICLAKHQKTAKHLQLLNSILQKTCNP